MIRNLRLLRRALWDVEVHGRPRIPGSIRTRPDGQVTARVFPYDVWDQIFYTGVTADVWMEPGVTAEGLPKTMAVAYHEDPSADRPGAVALVLGGGNVTSIGPMDALYKLFVEDQVVLFKTHPANVYLGPLIEESFKPLIDRGLRADRLRRGRRRRVPLRASRRGGDPRHGLGPRPTRRSFRARAPRGGAQGARRAAHTRAGDGELGNVSPVIVVPGRARGATPICVTRRTTSPRCRRTTQASIATRRA